MRIFYPNCEKEVQNKEVYINPCIKCEKIDGKDHYFAVADVRTMCENEENLYTSWGYRRKFL